MKPRRYLTSVVCITIKILDIIHRPGFHLKSDVSETGLDPIDRISLCLSIGPC
jgi:hypothetical protein